MMGGCFGRREQGGAAEEMVVIIVEAMVVMAMGEEKTRSRGLLGGKVEVLGRGALGKGDCDEELKRWVWVITNL